MSTTKKHLIEFLEAVGFKYNPDMSETTYEFFTQYEGPFHFYHTNFYGSSFYINFERSTDFSINFHHSIEELRVKDIKDIPEFIDILEKVIRLALDNGYEIDLTERNKEIADKQTETFKEKLKEYKDTLCFG